MSAAPPRPGPVPRDGGTARRALLLVCLFAIASSTSYTAQGPLLGLLADDFRLSSAEAGAVATAFFSGAMLLMVLGGLLADRFGPRRMLTLGFALAAVGTLGSGLAAPSYQALLAWRFASGLGSALGFPAGASYTRGVFRGGQGAHLAQGLYGASFLLGSGAALLFMPWLAGPAGDWRRAFALLGLGIGLVWLAWALLAPADAPGARAASSGASFGAAVHTRNVWLLGLCHMSGFGLAMIVGTWATAYFEREFRLPLAMAGALGSALSLTGIAGRAFGGALLERGLPAVWVIRGSLAGAVVGLLSMAVAPMPGLLALALAGLLATGLGVGLPYAGVFNGAAASAPRGPASAQAIVGWAGGLVTIVGPPLVGALLDATGSFAAGFGVRALFTAVVLASTGWLRPFALSRS